MKDYARTREWDMLAIGSSACLVSTGPLEQTRSVHRHGQQTDVVVVVPPSAHCSRQSYTGSTSIQDADLNSRDRHCPSRKQNTEV